MRRFAVVVAVLVALSLRALPAHADEAADASANATAAPPASNEHWVATAAPTAVAAPGSMAGLAPVSPLFTLSPAVTGFGQAKMGLREQIIFPEIEYDKVEKVHGMNITIVTTAPSDEEARELLRGLGMPFRN